jgi:glucose 1-dehydrogenase
MNVETSLNQQPSARRLAGRVALVTGAARGIGRGIALCMAEEGADVIVNDLPPTPAGAAGQATDGLPKAGVLRTAAGAAFSADATAREITSLGRQALACYADVSDRAQMARLLAEGVARFGRIDIAVANAAYSDREPFLEASWEGVLRTIEVTQFGVFHTCQAAARQMAAQGGGGKIIIIGSLLGEIPAALSAAYTMAKAAINHLARTLAIELAPQRINVNVINPGYIDTPGERKFADEELLRRVAPSIPWQRLGAPRDIGRAAVFLASDDADYVTGSALLVDGGYKVGMRLPPS